MKSVKIIAEAGVNHNGSEKLALELINIAHSAGADVVKFQTFKASKLVTEHAEKADYQVDNTGIKESQLEMLQRLELSYEAHHRLISYCNSIGIEFLSTAFDSESLDFLVNDLGLQTLKLPSGDLTNAPLVLEHARTGCDLIVSTGMATLSEVEMALGVIAFGLTAPRDEQPTMDAFESSYFSLEGQIALKNKVTLLHCTSEYPAPLADINLKAMDTLADSFKLPVGFSDHSAGISAPTAAVARGACILEKHFTLDKSMEGPDHKASLDPSELKDMVQAIRDVELALGDGIKGPRPSEVKNKAVGRKSLVAAKDITKGDIFTPELIEIKRPGNGLSPCNYWKLLNTVSKKSYEKGDLISA